MALIPSRGNLGSRQLSPSSEQSHMERSLFSDSHPFDVEDVYPGVSIGGLGNHALNGWCQTKTNGSRKIGHLAPVMPQKARATRQGQLSD